MDDEGSESDEAAPQRDCFVGASITIDDNRQDAPPPIARIPRARARMKIRSGEGMTARSFAARSG
jgi:hypothetical protein